MAALCGVRTEVRYEGQAAIELEALASGEDGEPYSCEGLDMLPVVRAISEQLAFGEEPARVAARFHATLAAATAEALQGAATAHGVATVVLSGGVFQNQRLLKETGRLLRSSGLRVLAPEQLPPNDGGISFGQAVVVARGEFRL